MLVNCWTTIGAGLGFPLLPAQLTRSRCGWDRNCLPVTFVAQTKGGRGREEAQLHLHFFNLCDFLWAFIFGTHCDCYIIARWLRRGLRCWLRRRLWLRCDYFLVKFCGLELCKTRVCLAHLRRRSASHSLPFSLFLSCLLPLKSVPLFNPIAYAKVNKWISRCQS